jgi:capsular polysaccharide export protein
MQAPAFIGWLRFAGKRVLLLQGPHGPFFNRVTRALWAAGARAVEKINFNGGDQFFYPAPAQAYKGSLTHWPAYLAEFLQKNHIDCILVFGDCRPLHQAAYVVSQEKNIEYWVFEEGYIRPNFITLEQHGVNAHSRMPQCREPYDQWQHDVLPHEVPAPRSFGLAAKYAMQYYAAAILARPWYRHYRHHRSLSLLDGLYWVRSFVRKTHYRIKEFRALADLKPRGKQTYFLVVLQVASDAQVTVHSPFASIADFIEQTVDSFVQHAAADAVLLIKHHPMDRGYTDYSRLVDALANKYALNTRLRYIHDQHLPTLLQHAEGVITINSTVGLSALFHGTAVIALGAAMYDMEGLTCQIELDVFWQQARCIKPDPTLHNKFRSYVTVHTQINGNFYVEMPGGDAAGVQWPTVRSRAVQPPSSA